MAPTGAATFGAPAAPPAPGQPGGWVAPGVPAAGGWAPAPTGAAAAKGGRSVLGGLAAVAGGVLTILGVFSGWVTLDPGSDSETVSGWSLTAGEGILKSSDPYLIVGLGVAAVLMGLLLFAGVARPLVRIGAIIVGVGIIGACAMNWMSVAGFVEDNLPSDFTANTAIGFYLAIAGGVVTAVSGLLPAKK